jgi:nucleoside-diphosphate-sugar epimerase
LKGIPYSKAVADITRPETLPAAINEVDYVIHLAGSISAKDEDAFLRVNRQGTLNLITAVRDHHPELKKFVLVSSVAACGPASGTPRREEDPSAPLTAYGRSKLAGEEVLRPFYDQIPITIIRPPAVYGPGDRAILTLFSLTRRGFKPYMAGGHNRVHMVYVDDLALGIKAAMESEQSAGQTYFIAETDSHTVREMLNIMADLQGRKGIGLALPFWLLDFFAFVSEFFSKMVGRAPLFSRDKVRELTSDWKLDLSKARRQLEFASKIDFTTGARITIDWYVREGWLK